MRLVFNNFQSLMSTLSDVTVVSDDSYNDDSLKSIIFKIAKAEDGQSDKVSVLGVNALITMDKSIEPSEFDCTCDVSEMNEQKLFIFQISSKNLMAFLNAYKSSRRTTVKSITFENEGGKISCTIVEIDKVTNTSSEKKVPADDDNGFMFEDDEPAQPSVTEGSGKEYVSRRMFPIIPIKKAYYDNLINIKVDEVEFKSLSVEAMKLITTTTLSFLSNDTSPYSYVSFDESYAVAAHSAFVCCIENALKDDGIFVNVRLAYKVMNFIDKVIIPNGECTVGKGANRIFFKTDKIEASCVFDDKLLKYKPVLEHFNRENAISFDRLYFKDNLKRLELSTDTDLFTIDITNQLLKASNSDFSTELPITNIKNMAGLDGYKFKLMPVALDKAIIGSDEMFVRDLGNGVENRDIFMYVCHDVNNPKNSVIGLSDGTGMWFTILRVAIMQ